MSEDAHGDDGATCAVFGFMRSRESALPIALLFTSALASVGCIYTREFEFVVRDPKLVSVRDVHSGSTHELHQPGAPEALSDGTFAERGSGGGIAIDVRGDAVLDAAFGRSFRQVIVRRDGVVNADGPLDAVEIVEGTVRVPACYGTGKHRCARWVFVTTPECNVSVLRQREVPLRALGAGWLVLGGAGATAFAFQMDGHRDRLAVDAGVLGAFLAIAAVGVVNLVGPSGRWMDAMQPHQCPQ